MIRFFIAPSKEYRELWGAVEDKRLLIFYRNGLKKYRRVEITKSNKQKIKNTGQNVLRTVYKKNL